MRVAETLNEHLTGDKLTPGQVSSSQSGVHPRLEQTVNRHLDKRWSQPLHKPSVESYQRLRNESSFADGQPFILDSGCGTGKSTRQLARQHPGHLVIGVDRSEARLAKSGLHQNFMQSDNCILLRADLPTFWRLLGADNYIPDKHLLFYPNPWPKPGHLQRRWHGHPVFPQLLCLGGEIEMRCNWEIYALEFAQATSLVTGKSVESARYNPRCGASPFEQKYLERAQKLYAVIIPGHITDEYRLSRRGKLSNQV